MRSGFFRPETTRKHARRRLSPRYATCEGWGAGLRQRTPPLSGHDSRSSGLLRSCRSLLSRTSAKGQPVARHPRISGDHSSCRVSFQPFPRHISQHRLHPIGESSYPPARSHSRPVGNQFQCQPASRWSGCNRLGACKAPSSHRRCSRCFLRLCSFLWCDAPVHYASSLQFSSRRPCRNPRRPRYLPS